MDAASLVAELKRRRVFRVLVCYGIVSFAVLQVIEPVMHGLHWPDAVLSYVVVALAAGFPIVVSLAWIFDVNAGRIERTAPTANPPSRSVLGLMLVGIGLLAAAPGLAYYFLLCRPADYKPGTAPSVAVLPFVNMSADNANEYFSDGMSEELINALANVPGLRVASRTSAFAFKGKNLSIQRIGQELSVGAVVEGSIRREGGRMRITAQLIEA